jgi:hypothetical protein
MKIATRQRAKVVKSRVINIFDACNIRVDMYVFVRKYHILLLRLLYLFQTK